MLWWYRLYVLGDGSGKVLYNDATLGNQYPVKLFGFEDLWGKLWEFRPGIRFYMDGDTRYAVVYSGNQVSNTANGRKFTIPSSANGEFITRKTLGAYWDAFPQAVGGGDSTYYCDGFWASTSGELLYYSIAAGVAMIFATGVGWATQVRYGNITLPLFIVLVISYMMKDRIKDLMRFYFAHRLVNKYYDKKAPIKIGNGKCGELKEGVDFISGSKIDPEVMRLRSEGAAFSEESGILEEKVLLYRQRCVLDGRAMNALR